ncbi:MAG: asparaginase [Clostridia bacterium]|nr:asparaginase [Clostridia bacterium]
MKNCKRVLIIYTGGTIGMKKTENGYAPAAGFLKEALLAIDDMRRPELPSWELIEMNPLLDSSNVAFTEWNAIARVVYENYSDYDGFVILHGTDTMAYTASALSFILDGLNKPVVLTGSQIPLSELRSDGRENLISSILIASEGIANEVSLCFSGRLLRGNRAMKMSADGLMAFDSPNYPHLAEVGITVRYNFGALARPSGENGASDLHLRPFVNVPIGVLKIFPGMQFGLFEEIMTERLSGIVLETFGAGNIPMADKELLPIIKSAFSSGAVITVCSQCPGGTVSLGTYETSRGLKGAGAVSGYDMTTEAAVAKLYHLFSLGIPSRRIKELMETNIRGELTRA